MGNDGRIAQIRDTLSTTAVGLFHSGRIEHSILSPDSAYRRLLNHTFENWTSSSSKGIRKNVEGSDDPYGDTSIYTRGGGRRYFRNNYGEARQSFKILSYIPDQLLDDTVLARDTLSSRLLTDVPDKNSGNDEEQIFSLYQGFEATVPSIPTKFLTDSNTALDSELSKFSGDLDFMIPKEIELDIISETHSTSKLQEINSKFQTKLKLVSVQKKVLIGEINEISAKIRRLKDMQDSHSRKIATLEEQHLLIQNGLQLIRDRLDFVKEYGLDKEENSVLSDTTSTSTKEAKEFSTADTSETKMNNPPPDQEDFKNVNKLRKIYTDDVRDLNTLPTQRPSLRKHYSQGVNVAKLPHVHEYNITCLDFDAPFGTLCTAGRLEHTIKILDLSRKQITGQLNGHFASVNCMQLSASGNFLVSGAKDATVKIWNVRLAKHLYEETDENIESPCIYTFDSHSNEVTALSFHARNLVTASEDKTIRYWDLKTGKNIQTIDVSFVKTPTSSFSETEPPFIGGIQCFDAAMATGTKDGLIRLWDLRSGKIIRTLAGRKGAITCLKFDSKDLVAGSNDGTVRIWDLRSGSPTDIFSYGATITSLDFDASSIVSTIQGSPVKILDRKSHTQWELEETPVNSTSNTGSVDFVRYRNGCLIGGRSNGTVDMWAI